MKRLCQREWEQFSQFLVDLYAFDDHSRLASHDSSQSPPLTPTGGAFSKMLSGSSMRSGASQSLFKQAELRKLTQSHRQQAAQHMEQVGRWQQHIQALTAALDNLGVGLAEISRSGKIRWATPSAERILGLVSGRASRRAGYLPENVRQWLHQHRGVREANGHLSALPWPLVHEQDGHQIEIRLQQREGKLMLLCQETRAAGESSAFTAYDLTRREGEILSWLMQGKSNPEIGVILQISRRTVDKHVERIFMKLGVVNRAEAVARALALQRTFRGPLA